MGIIGLLSTLPGIPYRARRRPSHTPSRTSTAPDGASFPRTDWTGQPALHLDFAATSSHAQDRIEYGARVASQNWKLLADRGRLEYIEPVMYKLAVLDKVFELCVFQPKRSS